MQARMSDIALRLLNLLHVVARERSEALEHRLQITRDTAAKRIAGLIDANACRLRTAFPFPSTATEQ